jgi:uncharacterized membrane protein
VSSAHRPPKRWTRQSDELEFDRVSFFTDAVFAIAMTLLIVGVGAPVLRDTTSSSDLAQALRDNLAQYVAFFIGFAVLGNYWMVAHRFYGKLQAIDGGYVAQNLLYLAFVAWLPFPTGVLGRYWENPVAIGFFAVSAAAVSACEALLFRRAYSRDLFRKQLSVPVYRYAMRASLLPVAFFFLSVPIAFLSTALAIVTWGLTIPTRAVLVHWKPADVVGFCG